MNKWNSRHVIIGAAVLLLLFAARFVMLTNGSKMSPVELPLWYDTIVYLTGIIVFGHAANKLADSRGG